MRSDSQQDTASPVDVPQLDEKDRQILSCLQKKADITLRELSQILAMSQASVWRRIQAYENDGLIRQRVTLLDPAKAGLPVCMMIQVKLSNHDQQTRDSFTDFIDQSDVIMEAYTITGEADYLLTIRVANVSAYEDYLMQEVLNHPAVASASTTFTLRQVKYKTDLPL